MSQERSLDRRGFMGRSALTLGAVLGVTRRAEPRPAARGAAGGLRLGLCTYRWGAELELQELLDLCAASELLGVELRTTHRHGVEPGLGPEQRALVRRRFEESGVSLAGIGSDERFDSPDPQRLQRALQTTRRFLHLSHDVGAGGVKVKPDSFHDGVPREETIEQIGRSLRELAPLADELGQELRLEAHGSCARLSTLRAILDVADHQSVVVCWNSNPQDLQDGGLEANFALVRDRLGGTVHVGQLDDEDYPYARLLGLLAEEEYGGWVLLEARSAAPPDLPAALEEQRALFERLLARDR